MAGIYLDYDIFWHEAARYDTKTAMFILSDLSGFSHLLARDSAIARLVSESILIHAISALVP